MPDWELSTGTLASPLTGSEKVPVLQGGQPRGATTAQFLAYIGGGSGNSLTLTGDIAGTGTGTISVTIGANKVTFGKLVQAGSAGVVGAGAAGNYQHLTFGPGFSVVGGELRFSGGGATISDGSYGDIVASSSGAVLTIGTHTVSFPKLIQAPSAGIIGAGGSGNYGHIPLGAGLAISGGALVATGSVTLSDGDRGDIIVSGGGTVFTVEGHSVTFAKFVQAPSAGLVGASGSGDYQHVGIGSGLTLVGGVLSASGGGGGGTGNLSSVATRTALAAISGPTANDLRYLNEAGREGWFKFTSGNLATQVSADPNQGVYIPPSSASTGSSGAWVRVTQQDGVFNVKWFGAKADGTMAGIGTDDTVAIQRGIDFLASRNGGTLYFPDGIYIIGGALQDTGLSNAQIVLPKVVDPTTGMSVSFKGQTPPGITMSNNAGPILLSTITSGSGQMIGVKTTGDRGISRLGFYMENIHCRMVANPSNSCIDMSNIPMFKFENVRVDTQGTVNGAGYQVGIEPTYGPANAAYGIKGSLNNVPTYNVYDNVGIAGYYFGLRVGELTTASHMSFGPCHCAMQIPEMAHISRFGYIVAGNCPNYIDVVGGPSEVYMLISIEHDTVLNGSGPSWVEPFGYDIIDPNNYLHGEITIHMHDFNIPLKINGAGNADIREVRRLNGRSFFPLFSNFPSLVDGNSIRQIYPRQVGKVPWNSLVGSVSSNTGVVAVWSAANASAPTSLPNSEYRVAQIVASCDGALNRGLFSFETANGDGTVSSKFVIDSYGNFGPRAASPHLTQASANSDLMGIIHLTNQTSVTKTLTRAFNTVPLVLATPDFDLGAGVRYWVSATTTTVTVTCSAAVTGNFVYLISGNPN
jgi:hypothetical protein